MKLHDTFLDKLSKVMIENHKDSLFNIQIVLPNNRAKIFLTEALKNNLNQTAFAPEIISIEELIKEMSQLTLISSVELMFQFYEVYLEVCRERHIQAHDFDLFSGWAKMLLGDFNEIDRYLLDPKYVFSYLKDIEDIKHWSVDPEQRTGMITNYLEFWNLIPVYYEKLLQHLMDSKLAYQGMMYRKAVQNMEAFLVSFTFDKIVFAGFNALNKAEELMIQKLLSEQKAEVYWDTDEVFINDVYHDAGLFAREVKKWKYYQKHPFEWVVNEFGQNKKIEIINTPKSVGQARVAGSIIEKWMDEDKDLSRSAVVLAEEKLLLPVLHSLPEGVGSLNITMGYESVFNPVQLFISKWFKMHLNAQKRDSVRWIFYHKEVIEVFSHPLFSKVSDGKHLITEIHKRNLSFFTYEHLFHTVNVESDFQRTIISKWDNGVADVLQKILDCLFVFRQYLLKEGDHITLAFLHSVYSTIIKIQNYVIQYPQIDSVEQLYSVYRQIVELEEVSFEGEPLEGLQIMGVLESRVLDFDRVIITSMNEGKFPAGKSNHSFIPHDVKVELGLPTYKQKDAIYSYHFYHLLLRAREIYLIYNSDNEGLDKGEKSRFITQIELEPQPNHKVIHKSYYAETPHQASKGIEISVSELLQERLKEIATQKGFSPSALSGYLRDPFQFYMQRVLRINEVDEVEENVALNTLGTIIHGTLESLYRPCMNQILTEAHLNDMLKIADSEIKKQFDKVYAYTAEHTGKNLLAFEVAKRNVYHFLQYEKKHIGGGDEVKIIGLEEELLVEIHDEKLPYPVKIRGFVDRIEVRNGVIRIIDYKTGKVLKSELKINVHQMFTADLKYEKIIQLLGYALMYEGKRENNSLQAGIYSFKNRGEGIMVLEQYEGRTLVNDVIDDTILEYYRSEIVKLISQILDPDLPFVSKESS